MELSLGHSSFKGKKMSYLTIYLPKDRKWLPTYLLVLCDLGVYWSRKATVSAKPLDVVLDSVRRHKK